MKELNSQQKFKIALERTVPIVDPEYIIGEEDSLKRYNEILESLEVGHSGIGIIGTTILGQIGNGKTHFLRFVKKYYESRDYESFYIPDMFVSGPLVDAVNSIYKSFFNVSTNAGLKKYLEQWHKYKNENIDKPMPSNFIIERLQLCSNESEEKILLDYFSGKDLIPDQFKHIKNKFGLKKKFINNDNDFVNMICDSLEFVQIISGKKILILLDEVDKVYSAETNKVNLSRVGLKLLTIYRSLFDALNTKRIIGAISIGATPEAWNVLSEQAAFERRFKDNKILLKIPKTVEDCLEFLKKRLYEMNIEINENEEHEFLNIIKKLPDQKRKTWADVISNLKNIIENKNLSVIEQENPELEILNVLKESFVPLTWKEIRESSDLLRRVYGNSQPTSILTKLQKSKLIKSNATKPKTYEPMSEFELDEEV